MDNELRDYLWNRQYAQYDGEPYDDGLWRVAMTVGETPEEQQIYYEMMARNEFIPGGRILQGASSPHGNMLNCYVMDGDPDADPTTRTTQLAQMLAIVTKVGGGNGLNLDYLPPKKWHPTSTVGKAYVSCHYEHKDYDNIHTGRFLDLNSGETLNHRYQHIMWLEDKVSAADMANLDSVIVVEDSVTDIWASAHAMVEDMLAGRNVLVDLSLLRPEGAPVSGSGGVSSGPASFAVEIFDNFAHWAKLGGGDAAGPVATLRYVFAPTLRVIRQAGVRRGAGMATLSVWHPDIYDFITAKDLSREADEGDISTFNISVLVDDQFMQTAKTEGTECSAILRAIAEQAHATGEPGLIFIDTVNNLNPLLETDGPIKASNPCGEVFLYPGEPCDLGAINLAQFVKEHSDGPFFDWWQFEMAVRDAVKFLDDVLDAHNSPLLEIAEAIEDKRRIGLGVMGLADALIKLNIRYGSEEAQEFAEEVAKRMAIKANFMSAYLGRVRGVPEGVKRAGLERRNIALLTVAPTGTTSMLAGVSSGIEPVFSASISRRIGTEYKTVKHPLANHPAFVTAHEVTPYEHVMMQAAFQRGMDLKGLFAGNSISKTINLPNEASVEGVEGAFRLAWEEGCKDITVYRDGSRGLQVLTEIKDEPETEVDKEEFFNDLFRPDDIDPNYTDVEQLSRYEGLYAPEDEEGPELDGTYFPDLVRPPAVRGKTYKYEVGPRKVYVTVNRGPDGRIVEVFVNFSRPTDQERTAGDIIGRLISLSLKHGAPPEDVITHLFGHMDRTGGFVSGLGHFDSIWDAVAQALQEETQVKPDISHLTPDPCPDCGAGMAREEGCMKCYSCGYSECR